MAGTDPVTAERNDLKPVSFFFKLAIFLVLPRLDWGWQYTSQDHKLLVMQSFFDI